jgi:oligopeptide transport system ATP-binding protein
LTPLLQVEDLRTEFRVRGRTVHAVNGVSYQLEPGQTLGLVGESGSGKSVSALSILRLVPEPPGKIVGGRVLYEGRDLLSLDRGAMERVRGREIAMIFQDATTAPPVTIVAEPSST